MNLKGKTVLVTGADGFIGSHLTEQLLEEGCNVKAFIYYNSFGSWGWLDTIDSKIQSQIEIIAGDIRDPFAVKSAIKEVDIVFHLAALIAIPYSYVAPSSYVETNINGTLNILQAARDFNLEKVIITSTSEVYGTAQFVPITEAHPKQAQSPYSATKIAADSISESFYKSFNLPVTIVRPFNTYGPRQSNRAIIPTIITQLLSGSEQIKLGDTTPTRDLLFVIDSVNGFIEAAKSDNLIGSEVNIATGSEISVGELASKIISLINPNASIVSDEIRIRPEASEVFRLLGSNEKLKNNSNWRQKYSLDQGLSKTIEWFKNPLNLVKYKSDQYGV